MPNWVENELTIKGKKEEVANFLAKCKTQNNTLLKHCENHNEEEQELDFNNFIPYPKEFKDADDAAKNNPTLKDGYNNGGYDWSCREWGCKWNASESYSSVTKLGTSATISFETPWSPPIPVIVAMSKMFPTLKLKIASGRVEWASKDTCSAKMEM